MSPLVRRATEADMAAFAEIVNAHILGGVAHFGDRPQGAGEWQADWVASADRYPWLVADRDGLVAGIAYARRFNARAAYDWTAETTVYVRDGWQGQGIGRALYARLLAILDAQGYRCVVAGITLPNPASVALHEAFGFRHLGTIERVGYKHGRWHDVGSYQRLAGPADDAEPPPIRPVSEVEPALGAEPGPR